MSVPQDCRRREVVGVEVGRGLGGRTQGTSFELWVTAQLTILPVGACRCVLGASPGSPDQPALQRPRPGAVCACGWARLGPQVRAQVSRLG